MFIFLFLLSRFFAYLSCIVPMSIAVRSFICVCVSRSSAEGRLSSLNELSTMRSRTSTSSTNQSHLPHQQQQQQQHPFVSARVDQFMTRLQLTALQPVRPPPAAASGPGWLAGRKSSAATDEDNLDRLVEINARQLVSHADTNTRSSSAVRRPPQSTNAPVASPSTVYTRAKALPVINNVAKPFSIGRNY